MMLTGKRPAECSYCWKLEDINDTTVSDRVYKSKIYSLEDAYLQADLVTYPSRVEGFGNAFLETVYYKRPIVMSTYEIFKTDIQPKGFKVIGFGDYIDNRCIAAARDILSNPEQTKEMTEINFSIGKRNYSFDALEFLLMPLLNECLGK